MVDKTGKDDRPRGPQLRLGPSEEFHAEQVCVWLIALHRMRDGHDLVLPFKLAFALGRHKLHEISHLLLLSNKGA